jgi:hypothetical protein
MANSAGAIGGPPLTGGNQIPAIGSGGGGGPVYIGAAPADSYYLLWSADGRLTNSKVFPGPIVSTSTGSPPVDTTYLWQDDSTSPAVIKYYNPGTSTWVAITTSVINIYNGSGVPSSGLGANGEYYINTSNGDFYNKSGGAWTYLLNLRGPTGASIVPRGPWSNLTTYNVNDIVGYAGDSYIAILTSTNVAPDTDPTKWTLLIAGDKNTLLNSSTDTTPNYLSNKLDASATFTWTTTTPGGNEKSKINLASAAANKFLASPDGSSGVPTARSIVNADLPDTGVAAGSYTNPNITLNSKGVVTSISNGTGGGGGSGGGIGIGGAACTTFGPGYQLAVGNAAYIPAPLLDDNSSGDTMSGYNGSLIGNYNKVTTYTTNMVARWLCNETSGLTLHDSVSTPTNDLTISGAATFGTDTNAAFWNPNTSRNATTSAAILTGTGSYSIEFLVKSPTISGIVSSRVVISQGVSTAPVFEIGKTGGTPDGIWFATGKLSGGGTWNINTSKSYSSDVLLHGILSYDSTAQIIYLYLNGVLEGSATVSGGRKSSTSETIYAASDSTAPGSTSSIFTRSIYYLAIYSQYLTSTDVQNHYNELVGSADRAGTTLLDLGAYGFSGASSIALTRGWANTGTEVCEYSTDGTTWTNIFTNTISNSGVFTFSQLTTTVSLGIGTWRYLRYSLKDTGGGVIPNRAAITDFRVI